MVVSVLPRYKLPIDITGIKFGRLVALRRTAGGKNSIWACQCVCGSVVFVSRSNLNNGHTSSCGCWRREVNLTHGDSETAYHRNYKNMRQRCENKNNPRYKDYGGRGIKVCERWRVYENYKFDMGPRPSKIHTIERIDNDGDYSPENCMWGLPDKQSRNKRSNIMITAFGRTLCITDWCREIGRAPQTIKKYLDLGNTPEEILSLPRHFRLKSVGSKN